jgi:hypothetical protein
MKLNKNKLLYWSKGHKFKLNNKIYQVKDVDVENYYQTDHQKIYLKYKVGKNDHWIDSEDVERFEKGK